MESITAEELEARIKEILNYGHLTYSPHVIARMDERNYAIGDILHILRNGKVLKYKREKSEEYRCEVHGEDLEGVNGAVIAIVVQNYRLIILTVLGGA